MRHKLRLSGLLALGALLLGQQAYAGQQVALRWQFEEGERLVYRMNMTSETRMPGGVGMVVSENTTTMSWEVLEVTPEGDASVRMTTDRVQMRMQSPMGNMDIDSDEPSDDPTARMMTALVGTGYTVVFDASGQIEEVLGLEEMRAALRESMSARMGAQGNAMMDRLLDQMASEEGIRSMIRQGYAAFPPEPVQPGETWDVSFDLAVPMVGTMTSTSRMTLDHVEERGGARIAVIAVEGTMHMSPDDDPGNPVAGMLELADAATSGTMEWNTDRGRLVRTTQTMTMEMSMTPPDGQRISIPISMNMLMELVAD